MTKFFLLIISLFLISCKADFFGTNTGNPELVSDPANGTNPFPIDLAFKICTKVQNCHPQANLQNCYDQIVDLQGYTLELGATAANYETLRDLESAEKNQLVTPNQTNFESCTKAIGDLSCSDNLIQSSYSTADPTNFSETNLLFRSSSICSQIY